VEYLLQLYLTQDVRQIHIIYGAIERTIVDSAQTFIEEEKSNTWITTKATLIKAFKDHRPYEDIIQHVRDTQYQGSISKYVNELQFRSSKVNNKLELESDQIERSIYTNFLNKTIKDCIERKLPDRLYNSISKKDISILASTNRNQNPPRNQGNYHEFRRNLDQGRAQYPLNFQASPSNNSPNASVKRQRGNECVDCM